jgi:hypothetical protein
VVFNSMKTGTIDFQINNFYANGYHPNVVKLSASCLKNGSAIASAIVCKTAKAVLLQLYERQYKQLRAFLTKIKSVEIRIISVIRVL